MRAWLSVSVKDAWVGLRLSRRGPIWTAEACLVPFVMVAVQWKSPSFLAEARRSYRSADV